MPKITHVVVNDLAYDVSHLTADTQAELVKDLPRYDLNAVMKKYNVTKTKKCA
ncbi:MAG: hypothetical protein OIN88_04765 [Candidatus Methanoperedens sp.]|nr:hypothetical protein [Candidatus Methanoperedens sp.]MCZ7360333.1 hypothetical protein [Candidatus Methanoperedens sp.]